MSWDILAILTLDGLTNGAIYLMAGLGLVLIYSVTRVIFVPFGDIAVFSAMTLAAFQAGTALPATVWLVATLAALACWSEVWQHLRQKNWAGLPKALLFWGAAPAILCGLAVAVAQAGAHPLLQVLATLLLVVPIGPLVARVALQPIANASGLVLLIASLVLHFLLSGLGLLFFGPEGIRTSAQMRGGIDVLGLSISGQTLLILGAALAASVLFYLAFERTLTGKALRATAVNQVGARLVGIRPARTALWAYGSTSLLAGLVGILIAPVTTLYYDSGLLIGLKAFVAAIIGGLVSYPLTAVGAVAVGIVESFASFWNGTFKDVIVFVLLIPVLLVRSTLSTHSEEDPEEIES